MQMKNQPNRERYMAVLRSMTPEQRLQKALELTETSRELLRIGIRQRHPDASESELQALYLMRLNACHNKNY